MSDSRSQSKRQMGQTARWRGAWLVVCAVGLSLRLPSGAQQGAYSKGLHYDSQTRGPVPIPPSERNLQTAVATLWFKVSKTPMVLEGPSFDRAGNLLVSDVYEGRVLRITPDKKLSMVFSKEGLGPGGLAIHKDGRIFIAGIHDLRGSGSIMTINPDGSGMQTIIPLSAGYQPNDLVFDTQGGFYFTDFRGTSTDSRG